MSHHDAHHAASGAGVPYGANQSRTSHGRGRIMCSVCVVVVSSAALIGNALGRLV